MSKNISINLNQVTPWLKKAKAPLQQHAVFITIITVLLVYVFMVWKISQFSNAEPSPDAETVALTKSVVPRIDQSAIQQIQSLEKTSPQVQSLFQNARTNPFQE